MRCSLRQLAASVTARSVDPTVRAASKALLPPIPLYRAILRAHRLLPVHMRSLGDEYVKAEFRRTRSTDNPLHIIGFLSEWKKYLDVLPRDPQSAQAWNGAKLNPELLEKMSDEQLVQLYDLMNAARGEDIPTTVAAPVDKL